jgi:hypothetical protein
LKKRLPQELTEVTLLKKFGNGGISLIRAAAKNQGYCYNCQWTNIVYFRFDNRSRWRNNSCRQKTNGNKAFMFHHYDTSISTSSIRMKLFFQQSIADGKNPEIWKILIKRILGDFDAIF